MDGRDAYPLGAALVLREREEEEARALLSDRLAAVREAEGTLAAIAQALDAARERLVSGPAPGRGSAALERAARFRSRLAAERAALTEELRVQGERVAQAREGAEAARESWLAARRERAALETHRERWTAERRRARQRAEEAEHDEAAGARRSRRT